MNLFLNTQTGQVEANVPLTNVIEVYNLTVKIVYVIVDF